MVAVLAAALQLRAGGATRECDEGEILDARQSTFQEDAEKESREYGLHL